VVVLAPNWSLAIKVASGYRISIMPSLLRFLVFISLLSAIGYVAVFSLATFVSYKPREITVTIPPDRFLKQPH
jgi:hypothetical protein